MKKNTNNNLTKKQEILDAARQVFEGITGCNIKILGEEPLEEKRPDAVLHIATPEGNTKKYYGEVKENITQATLGYAAEQIRRFNKPALLVTRYLTPPMAERLKALNVEFIDTAGNVYINNPPLFIYVIGKTKKDFPAGVKLGRAFRPTGLKVVFALLCQPELVKAPYREIVNVTKVAQGTVGWVFYDLKQQNYLIERGVHGRKLINVEKLIGFWVDTYTRELRPKLYMGTYKTAKQDWLKDLDWQKTNAFIGGETAAAILTDYLKPATTTIYGPEEITPFLIKHHLQKDPNGNVELYKKFWKFDYPWEYEGLAPPLLIYADLIATANDRNIDAARIIYDKFINRFIEKY
jgi:hypothetical protein